VSRDGWLGEAAELGDRELRRSLPERVGGWQPAGTEHYRYIVGGLASDLGQFRRARLGGGIRISHVVTIKAA
jgi:hypothetical protein